jgi:hypothetical protein
MMIWGYFLMVLDPLVENGPLAFTHTTMWVLVWRCKGWHLCYWLCVFLIRLALISFVCERSSGCGHGYDEGRRVEL